MDVDEKSRKNINIFINIMHFFVTLDLKKLIMCVCEKLEKVVVVYESS